MLVIFLWDYRWKYGEFWVQALSGSLLCSLAHCIQQCALPSLFYLSSVFCFLFNSFPCTMFYSQCKSLFSCIPSLYQTISQNLHALLSSRFCARSLLLYRSARVFSLSCLIFTAALYWFKRCRLLLNIDQSVVLQLIHYVNVSLAVVLH